MQCYCGAGEDHLPFCIGSFQTKNYEKKKPKIELRYYYMPAGSPILPLLGERWVQNYGTGIEDLHFHNFMEIGFCYYGEGILTLGEEKRKFTGRQFTAILKGFLIQQTV